MTLPTLTSVTGVTPPLAVPQPTAEQTRLRALATDLEAAFLAEMLGHAGFGKARESLGGGTGEDQFGSFLRQAQASEMARKGGIGLAESLFNALSRRQG
jgi:peptidoglycan hydrolase FlgJ